MSEGKVREFRGKYVTTTVDVDIDIDEAFLEENGFHHEDDCPSAVADVSEEDLAEAFQTLSDWLDQAHGLTLWSNCSHEPCRLLSDDFRRTP